MNYCKNEQIELQITDIGTEGEGIGKTDAFTWFIKDAVPGDKVRALVMKTKKTYGYARLLEILIPSTDRVTPVCPIARQCGGCSLQNLSYEAQLRFKENKVRNNLMRIGGFEFADTEKEKAEQKEQDFPVFFPIIGMEKPLRYRNKAEVPFGTDREGNITAGFYAGHTHCIVPCSDCLLEFEENKEILETVLGWMKEFRILPYGEGQSTGLIRHVLIRKGFSTGELMTCIISASDTIPHTGILCEQLMKLPGMKTVVLNVNAEPGNVILGKRTRILAGPGTIADTIGETVFRISAESFYQVNPVQTEKLYRTALEFADLTGAEEVWDLYCGIGTVSLFLAKKAKKVTGIEIVPQAVTDARENARENGIPNAEFLVGKAEEILPLHVKEYGARADVITVDPPRKGCDAQCLETILAMKPERIVYISCDSATLARDLKILCGENNSGVKYLLKKVQPVDMFPQTVHVETVVLMSRAKD